MEATLDAALASILFLLSISILFSVGYSSVFGYLEYANDVGLQSKARALSSRVSSVLSGPQEGVWRFNRNYGGGLDAELFSDLGINFALNVSFLSRLRIENIGGADYAVADSPVDVVIYDTSTGEWRRTTIPQLLEPRQIVVSQYGVVAGKSVTLDKSLVTLEGDVIRTKGGGVYSGYVFSDGSGVAVQVLDKMSVKDLGRVLAIVGGSGYVVLPPLYPWNGIAYIRGEFREGSVGIPPEAVYLSNIVSTSMDVPVLVEVWVWSAPS